MFLPISKKTELRILVSMPIIGIAFAITAYLLQTDKILFATAATGFLGTVFAGFQWLIVQWRESAKTEWEAVKLYYSEGDTETMVKIRSEIRGGDMKNAYTFCNFVEKWGRLVRLSYLPIELFNGTSGASICALFLQLDNHISQCRQSDNPRYAESFVWLVKNICDEGYLSGNDIEVDVKKMAEKLTGSLNRPTTAGCALSDLQD